MVFYYTSNGHEFVYVIQTSLSFLDKLLGVRTGERRLGRRKLSCLGVVYNIFICVSATNMFLRKKTGLEKNDDLHQRNCDSACSFS